MFPPDLVSVCLFICSILLLLMLPWRPERVIRLVTEIGVELQPLPFLLVQHEAVDVGEELVRRYRHDEALSVQSQLVQQHHAEVGPGDPEHLPAQGAAHSEIN